MRTTQAARQEPGRDGALEIESRDAQASEPGATEPSTRRGFLRRALGGAGVLALSASGAVAFRRADAKDDDDNSGSGSGGESGSGSGDDGSHGDDHDDDGDDDSGRGRGRGRGRGGDADDADGADGDARIAGTPVDGVTEVRITDDDADAFEPQLITVDLGAEVTFFNDDDDDHTATGARFDTGTIAPGGSATVTLDEPGEHLYACQFHPEMTGTIFVRDEEGNVPEATPAATPRVVEGASADENEETVAIANFAFDPADLTVPAGTTVTWENTDTAPHTATAAEDGGFDTGRIDPNAGASVTFDEPGTFAYFCAFHPNMVGTITVE